jgi:putative membrane protein
VATSTATTVAQTVTDQIAASVGGEDTQSTVSSALWDSLAAIGSGVAEQTAQGVVSTVNSQLVQTYDSLGTATQALADGSAQLSTGVSQLYTGTDQLVQGLGTLSEGAAALEAGSQTLNSGIQALESGSTTLHSNNSALSSGLASATEGAKLLKSGASALKDGTAELVDGTGDLSDGVDALLDGAQELMDGMTEFDEEGIQTLANLFHDDAEPLMDRLRALQDYAGEYTSFSGANDQYPSTVRFILRTDSIGE